MQRSSVNAVNLRARLALVVALATLFLGALVIVSAHVFAERELEQALDVQLRTASGRVLESVNGRRVGGGGRLERVNNLQGQAVFAQILTAEGDVGVALEGAPELPVDDFDLALASGSETEPRLRTLTIDGTSYRVLTRPLRRGQFSGAVQIAIDRTQVEDTLRGFDRRLIFLGLVGVLGAALVGYLVAQRIARPVEQLAAAATQVAVTRDFSQRLDIDRTDEVGNLAASFNAMLGALEESKTQQHQLVQDASHELRTPLTSVRTNIDVLTSRIDEMSPDQRDIILADLQNEVGELSQLVGELVDLATDTSGGGSAHSTVDLVELAGRLGDRFGRLHDRQIDVTGAKSLTVEANAEHVERATVNLITNAVKFSPPHSPITVHIREDPAGPTIDVIDTGQGIPEDDLPRIFDRFYRSDATRTLPGSGLGLAIVAQTAKQHGGDVWAHNNVGGGATVGFRLGTSTIPD